MERLRLAEAGAVMMAGALPAVVSETGTEGFYKKSTGGGARGLKGPKVGKGLSLKKASAGIVLIMVVIIVAVIALIINLPNLVIGALDFNLRRAVGMDEQKAVLQEQSQYISQTAAAEGEFPAAFANDLAAYGIEVGQVSLAGEFVRTNSYLANLDGGEAVAANGYYNDTGSKKGELVLRFNDKIIAASELVAALNSDLELYAAYSEAWDDIYTRFYYSQAVDEVFDEMDLSRSTFAGWETTGDNVKDEENFNKLLEETLDKKSSVTVNGYDEGDGSGFSTNVTGRAASEVVDNVASSVRGADATERAAQLLNSAIASEEPYRAAAAFMVIEESLQRARLDGTGPVNQVMNALTRSTAVTYTDVETNTLVTEEKSILETPNFAAAVSGGNYSRKEAANFSVDRVLNEVGVEDLSVVGDTTVATNGHATANIVLGISGGGAADQEALSRADNSVSIALEQSNSELFSSVVGGNRAVEGGLVIVNEINERVLGGMPADAAEVGNYNREAKRILARRAAAERATRSPFDVSSPYTFMGSLVHNFAIALIKNFASSTGNAPIISTLGTVADLTSGSVEGLFGGALAEGESENDLTGMIGDCETVSSAASAAGNLYCTSHNPISIKYMDKSDWGEIDQEELKRFIALGMGREITVGVKSSDVCERYKDFQGGLTKILDALSSMLGLYQSCRGVDEADAIGSRYVVSDSNPNKEMVELQSAYVRYDVVDSILKEKQSEVSKIKDEYYAQHPKKNSAAARVARISGMSEEEAELALKYRAYLNTIANYRPASRFKFGERSELEAEVVIYEEKVLQENIYYAWCGSKEFADVRNRNFVV